MLNKKIILIAILLISLLSLSAVSAAEDATSDIATASDETILDESIDDASIGDSNDDELILNSDDGKTTLNANETTIGTFTDLNDAINGNDDSSISLSRDYRYVNDDPFSDGVHISRDVTINGNGHTIDGSDSARIFYVDSGSVTFKNLNFINGHVFGAYDKGGAVVGGTSINCNFTHNLASGGAAEGGAMYSGTAINCTFNQNEGHYAGAMYRCTAINCTFIQNHARAGGAMEDCNAENCIFIGNHANSEGGAMYEGTATNCIFLSNSGGNGNNGYGTTIENCILADSATLNVSDFITEPHSGEKMLFTLTTDAGEILNNVPTTITLSKDGNQIGTFTALSGEGWATDLDDGTYTATLSVDGANVNSVAATIIVSPEKSFTDLNNAINGNDNAVITLTHDYKYYDMDSAFKNGISIDRSVTINGNGHTIDGSNIARIFLVNNPNVIIRDINFKNGKASNYGGAIYGECNVINCNFTNNTAHEGGGIWNANATNCTFTQNTAVYGGAIGYYPNLGSATNCNFINNIGDVGGAMYIGNAIICNFINNTANIQGNALYKGNAILCTFENNDNYGTNIITPNLTASDFTTTYNYGEKFIFTLATPDQIFDGVNTLLSISKNGAVVNYTAPSGSGWTVNLAPGTYIVELSVPNSNVDPIFRTITVAKNPAKITASAVTATYNVNKYLVIKLTDGKGKALSKVKVTVTLGTAKTYTTDTNGQIKINVATLVPKTYTATIKYAGNAYYVAASKSVKVVVKKATPKMTAKAKTFKVKVKTKKYTITLKTNKNKVMKKVKVTLKVNKKTFKATTNSKGVATFKITNLKKKGKYTATIKFAGNKYYKALSKKAKITVKK